MSRSPSAACRSHADVVRHRLELGACSGGGRWLAGLAALGAGMCCEFASDKHNHSLFVLSPCSVPELLDMMQ